MTDCYQCPERQRIFSKFYDADQLVIKYKKRIGSYKTKNKKLRELVDAVESYFCATKYRNECTEAELELWDAFKALEKEE